MLEGEIKDAIEKAVKNLKWDSYVGKVFLEKPEKKEFGDFSTNIALVLAKKLNQNPREIAESIKKEIEGLRLDIFEKIETAGPGFVNFFVSSGIFIENIKKINKDTGRNVSLKNKKVILDYTDPNPFKEFHIGHLMSNAIGESLSRLFEFEGAKVKRVCYQGDVGIHVAKAIWARTENKDLSWAQAYAFGAEAYEKDDKVKKEIIELNKKIYSRSDNVVNRLYDQGKKESLKYFNRIYKKLGTKFDYFIFESGTGEAGKKIVEEGIKKGVFEKSKGAVVFKGEKYGLHTRVFINSDGIPTYEAKDLGLAEIKYKKYRYDQSFVVTGNEINEYFKVMLCAMKQVLPDLAEKTKHIGHGMLRLPEGKMSSRTGKVITGESLIEKVEKLVEKKIKERELSAKEKAEIIESVAIGAIKYSILKQSIGSDIIYDFDKSISFEGDSGPYLQYSFARASSVLKKAKEEGIKPGFKKLPEKAGDLEKLMHNFSNAISESANNYEPHCLVSYLTELAGAFNSYYAKNKIVDKGDELSSYKVALASAFSLIMENGLWILGIKALGKM